MSQKDGVGPGNGIRNSVAQIHGELSPRHPNRGFSGAGKSRKPLGFSAPALGGGRGLCVGFLCVFVVLFLLLLLVGFVCFASGATNCFSLSFMVSK